MKTISKNGSGLAILIVSIATLFGLELDVDSTSEVIAAIGTLISFGLMIKNQLDRPDVENFLFKK